MYVAVNIAFHAEDSSLHHFIGSASKHSRDDCLRPYAELIHLLRKNGYNINTLDYFLYYGMPCKAVIFIDIPVLGPQKLTGYDSALYYLIQSESEVIKPLNSLINSQNIYSQIFSWSTCVDKKGIWASCFGLSSSEIRWIDSGEKDCLVLMINSNKAVRHSLELYSERKKIINWYEINHPDLFDLYGSGWDKCYFSNLPMSVANKVPFLSNILSRRYSCYKGVVVEKSKIMQRYKFAFCLENAKNIPGYITEKIFDAFMAGVVPIYGGAPDIDKYIPASCYIDYFKFKSLEELHVYISNMPGDEYEQYLKAISKFLSSPAAERFHPRYFAKTVAESIMSEINDRRK